MTCTYIKSNGNQCEAKTIEGSNYCFFHNPNCKEKRAIAVTKGGLNRKHYEVYGEEVKIETPKDIKDLLGKVINGVWTGDLPSNAPANTIGFLSRCFLDAHEASEVENRLDLLEDRLSKAGI